MKPKMGEEILQKHALAVNEPEVLALNELQCRALTKLANEFTHLRRGSFEGREREKSKLAGDR